MALQQMRGYIIVNDAAETPQTVYVGLYNTGGGMYNTAS